MFMGLGTLGAGGRQGRFARSAVPVAGYNLAARIAAVRAHPVYGSYWSSTADAFAPDGLVLPTPPVITSTVNVSSLAQLRSELSTGSGKHIILAPGAYTETSRTIFDVDSVQDVRLTLTGCTLNITGDYHSFTTGWRALRIEVIGGAWNAIPATQGIDIRVVGGSYLADNNPAHPQANNTGFGVCGHRILWEGLDVNGYNGLFFIGSFLACQFDGSISGTTLTATVASGALHVGACLDTFIGAAFVRPTYIEEQLSGPAGGSGTYRVSVSQTRANGAGVSYERSTNCIAANCSLHGDDVGTPEAIITENPMRINAGNHILILDSRLYSETKYTARFHPNWTDRFKVGVAGMVNCQIEGQGIQGASGGGIYPHADAIVLDGVRSYGDATMLAGPTVNMPRYGAAIISAISGNGSVATVTCNTEAYHGLSTGDVVDIGLATNAGFNATGVTVTVIDETHFSYANATVGTATYGSVQTAKPAITYLYMAGLQAHTAPTYGVNGAGVLPGANTPSSWPTCDTEAHSLASGNVYSPTVAAPAWAPYTSNPP